MKRIAITMNVDDAMPKNDTINQNYISYIESFGLYPVLIPNLIKNPVQYCEELKIDGIVFTGGCDVSPSLVNTQSNHFHGDKNQGRDFLEWQLLEYALKMELPVLGICRGMQLINVFFGGGIVYNIETALVTAISHVRKKHNVRIINSNFEKIIGSSTFYVNSFHCHGLTNDVIASSLCSFASCENDNIVEGIFHPIYPILGIQWHPERSGSNRGCDRKLLNAFFYNRKFW